MAANSVLSGAVQILCVIARHGEGGATAELMAKSLRTNPVVVRRIVKSLEKYGLVQVRHGRYGGVTLSRTPAAITLADIYDAVETDSEVFALRQNGNPRCPVNRAMKGLLEPVFAAAHTAVSDTLRKTRLSSLVEHIE